MSVVTPPRIRLLLAAAVLVCAELQRGKSGWASDPGPWEVGAVLDVAASSRDMAMGARSHGLQVGHSDLLIRGPLGAPFAAEAIFAGHTVHGRLEHHVEKFSLRTRTLPAGLSAMAGRFASQIGYLNEQHPHTDDFSERPLLYRGFFGGHWFDDGVRLNWTAPTPFYLRIGSEAISGRQLIKNSETAHRPGAGVVSLKTGGDLNVSNSWQFGLSYLNNRRRSPVHHHEEARGDDHAHGAEFNGKHVWVSDFVYKWSPNGDVKSQQLRLIGEHAQVSGIHPESGSRRHAGSTLAAVWRFIPAWEIGVRTDWLSVNRPELHHEDGVTGLEFGAARLREDALMVAYKPGHRQTYRMQVSRQRASGMAADDVFSGAAKHIVQFQVIFGFGAHSAHSY